MTKIYLDQNQSSKFNVPYFDAGKLVIAADALLKSASYDSKHTAFLKDADEDTLVLTRTSRAAPGWYKVEKVIPSFKRPQAVRDAFKATLGTQP